MNIHSQIYFSMTDKKQAIFEATQQLIARHGFSQLSMKMVAETAGVAAGTIYRYFAGKDELLRSLNEQLMLQAASNMLHDHDPSLPLIEQYRRFWLNTCGHVEKHPERLAYRTQFENSPYFNGEEQQQKQIIIFAPIVDFFDRGVRIGMFRPLPTQLLVELSLGSARHLVRLSLQHKLQLTDTLKEQVIQATWDTICIRSSDTEQELTQ